MKEFWSFIGGWLAGTLLTVGDSGTTPSLAVAAARRRTSEANAKTVGRLASKRRESYASTRMLARQMGQL
jgi:hypothetical protein